MTETELERGTSKKFWFRLWTEGGSVFAERENDSISLRLMPKNKKSDPRKLTRDEAKALARELLNLAEPTYESLSTTERRTGEWKFEKDD